MDERHRKTLLAGSFGKNTRKQPRDCGVGGPSLKKKIACYILFFIIFFSPRMGACVGKPTTKEDSLQPTVLSPTLPPRSSNENKETILEKPNNSVGILLLGLLIFYCFTMFDLFYCSSPPPKSIFHRSWREWQVHLFQATENSSRKRNHRTRKKQMESCYLYKYHEPDANTGFCCQS